MKFIFYPCIPYERNEFPDANNHYNCPIVTSYAENIKNNVDELNDRITSTFRNPFLALTNEETATKRLVEEFSGSSESRSSGSGTCCDGQNWNICRNDIRRKGEETLRYMEETGRRGIVLAGRPYHIDPEINHGIPDTD